MTVPRLRTVTQVLDFLDNYADTNVVPNGVARKEGSPLQDFINTTSQEMGNLYTIVTFVQQSQSIPGLQNLIDTDSDTQAFQQDMAIAFNETVAQTQARISAAIDDRAADQGLTRKPATKATCILRFYTTSALAANIPLNTTAQTQGLNPIQFQTTVAIVAQIPTLDPTTGLFFIDVSAEAVVPGSGSNVPLNVINQIAPVLAGFTAVTNITSATNGTDIESDQALLNRIKNAIKGTQLDTIFGLKDLIEAQPSVLSAFAVDDSDPLLTRGTGNLVDIWVLGDVEALKTDTITYNNSFARIIILQKQPVTSITQVTVNAVLKVVGVDYNFVKDTSGFSNSVRGNDKIVFVGGHEPNPGDTVVIEYSYNSLIQTLQNLFDTILNPQNQIPNADILVRQGFLLLIDVEFLVVAQSGFSTSNVHSLVTTNVTAYFTNLGLGQNVFESQVSQVVQGTVGVDHVEIPFTKLAITPGVGSADIPVAKNQYARLNSLVFD